MLGAKIMEFRPQVWMVNTGWTGGPFAEGHRVEIHHTRAMIHSVLDGLLEDSSYDTDPIFGLHVPMAVPGVPKPVLNPRDTWKDPQAYDLKASELAYKFREAFEPFRGAVSPETRAAIPGRQ
jgi:phosphoenolpyruvate carboxykinase (ATP)